MRRLGQTTANLARYRRGLDELLGSVQSIVREPGPSADRLTEVTGFGSNPGALRMFAYVPERLAPSPALVVVLHGCTQTAAGYDHGAGWSTLADRYGFALLLPEQQRANNPNNCFSWFQPGDIERDRGEALSIRQMVQWMVARHGIDRDRIFVTGLSAGGAMTSVMLAVYPDVFAGGAIVAGLPYGCASSVQEALETMYQGRTRSAREWGDLVRAASPYRGHWPRVSVWHGSADATVIPMNAGEIVKQWTDVHGLPSSPTSRDRVDGYPRRTWRGPDGEVLVEEYTITGMAHGTPLAPTAQDAPHGVAGPFLLDVGIASSYHIAKFWGLVDDVLQRPGTDAAASRAAAEHVARLRAAEAEPVAREPLHEGPGRAEPAGKPEAKPKAALPIDVQGVISRALRAAGLLNR